MLWSMGLARIEPEWSPHRELNSESTFLNCCQMGWSVHDSRGGGEDAIVFVLVLCSNWFQTMVFNERGTLLL